MTNPQGDDKPASVETCGNCGREVTYSRREWHAAAGKLCGTDTGSTEADFDCASNTVTKLRAEVETVRDVLTELDWDVEPTPAECIRRLVAEVETLRARVANTERVARVGTLLEIHELMRPGPDRREAYAALMNVSYKYGAMAEVNGICTIGDFSDIYETKPEAAPSQEPSPVDVGEAAWAARCDTCHGERTVLCALCRGDWDGDRISCMGRVWDGDRMSCMGCVKGRSRCPKCGLHRWNKDEFKAGYAAAKAEATK